ncbi:MULTISPECIES: serine hydrolase [unclassified Microbacterium]|uniref:serine hydrolase domain-containing protein n=1 Tax=unclassified Microbacterium TaxID=2609290 RepID=UPI001602A2D5|nr:MULTISPECIES: serine hydrolase domain-containing protein [unclassified Microbacterium]MBT2484581.1 beta-lactamase family protein [Microbacterium sp. ISL-108]
MTAVIAAASTVALLTGCVAATDQQPEPTSSAAAEVAPEIAAALEGVIEAGAVAVTVDVRDGGDAVQAAEGSADVEGDRAAEADDPVRIASISKTVLAVVVLQLVEEGKVSLDTTVEEVLPGLLSSAPGDVTVEQLLRHTSGLPDYIPAIAPDAKAAIDGNETTYEPEELVAIAQQQPWSAAPGSAFHYTNAGYTVLGLMAEDVSGEPVSDLMAARVLEPTGMDDTVYPEDASMPEDALRGYMTVEEDVVDMTEYEPSFWSFGASLVSTVGDVSAFNAALQGGELLEDETLEQMRSLGAEGYGMGVLAAGDACGAQPAELVYGQRGNGFGYNSLTLASADGQRVVTVAYTGGSFDPASDPVFPAVNELLVAGLASTCP